MIKFRIVFASREAFRVMNERFEVFPAKMAGKLRFQSSAWPSVGDYVLGSPQAGDWVLIDEVCPRTSLLARRDSSGVGTQILAANVDTLMIVTSANQDLNLNRLDRYVAMAGAGGVEPVILVNKMELVEDPHSVLDSVAGRFPGLEILGTSAVEGWNLDALHEFAMPGMTLAFVGSSGVGKSTLTNALLGSEFMLTSAIREGDGRGRHTTTHRELHVLPSGAYVIDTPGIRTVGLSDDADLDSVFTDVEALSQDCKFTDCRHSTEPGCAILRALEDGELDEARWESYLKLGRELAHEMRKTNKELQSLEKKKWAKISMDQRKKNGR